MKPAVKKTIKISATIIGAILLGLLTIMAALTLIGGNLLKKPLTDAISKATNRQVEIAGNLDLHLVSLYPSVTINGLSIGNPDWLEAAIGDQAKAKTEDAADANATAHEAAKNTDATQMASAEHITASVELLPLFIGRVIVKLFEIDDASVNLLKVEDGRANWNLDKDDKEESGKPFKLPAIKQLLIKNSKINYEDRKGKIAFNGVIESTENTHGADSQPFQLTGAGKLNNQPFDLKMQGTSLLNVSPSNPYDFNLNLALGATKIAADGEITKPFDLGQLQTNLVLSGNDLADLYYLTGLALPNTPPYKLKGVLSRDGTKIYFKQFAGTVGGSDLNGDVEVDTANKKPYLKADLNSKLLDFKDLGALFGAPPAKTVATASAPVKAAAANSRVLPDAPLQVERVRAMDADVTYKADDIKAPNLPLQKVFVDLSLKDAVLDFKKVAVTLPQGSVNGTAKINAQTDTPDVDVDFKLSNAKLESFFKAAASGPPALSGPVMARIKLHGRGDSVRRAAATSSGDITFVIPHGEIRQAFAELLGINVVEGIGLLTSGDQEKTELRCSVVNFKAQDGLLNANTFVFDTGVVLATGTGSINLKDESLDLSIKGEPKEATSVRIRAPILVTGTLGKPSIGLDPTEVAAQTGIATALGVLLTPLAAILPFVDAGDAENADCASLVRMAGQKAAPVKNKGKQ